MESSPISSSIVFGYGLKIKFEPFFIDYNIDKEEVMLPTLFNKQHCSEISEKVMLCDPAGNMFQVLTDVRDGETFFIQGWNRVGRFYGLHEGGWCRLVFLAANLFLIHFRDRLDRPVTYPSPAKITMLPQFTTVVKYPRSDHVPSLYANVYKLPDYFHTLEKVLTESDVNSGLLHIPLEFCEIAFQTTERSILIFDEYGLQATCMVEFSKRWPATCGIRFGWKNFCDKKNYRIGNRIQLGVPAGNPNIMSIIVIKKRNDAVGPFVMAHPEY